MLENIELFLLDMDGTLYLGDEVIDGAIDFVHRIAATHRRYMYLTNNSSRAGSDYIDRLRGLGFPCGEGDVFTSGMATAMYLNERHAGEGVFLVGTRAFARELSEAGVRLTDEDADVVVAGFDTELDYRKAARAVHFLRRGAKFIAANPDWVCPMPGGEALPDCGSICAMLSAASGAEPVYIGKPNRNMVDIISKMTGVPNSAIACVGDRLYTDIAVAKNAGALGICVLSGESTERDIASSAVQPDLVFPSVKEIAEGLQ